jgi:hypothetical protein
MTQKGNSVAGVSGSVSREEHRYVESLITKKLASRWTRWRTLEEALELLVVIKCDGGLRV